MLKRTQQTLKTTNHVELTAEEVEEILADHLQIGGQYEAAWRTREGCVFGVMFTSTEEEDVTEEQNNDDE